MPIQGTFVLTENEFSAKFQENKVFPISEQKLFLKELNQICKLHPIPRPVNKWVRTAVIITVIASCLLLIIGPATNTSKSVLFVFISYFAVLTALSILVVLRRSVYLRGKRRYGYLTEEILKFLSNCDYDIRHIKWNVDKLPHELEYSTDTDTPVFTDPNKDDDLRALVHFAIPKELSVWEDWKKYETRDKSGLVAKFPPRTLKLRKDRSPEFKKLQEQQQMNDASSDGRSTPDGSKAVDKKFFASKDGASDDKKAEINKPRFSVMVNVKDVVEEKPEENEEDFDENVKSNDHLISESNRNMIDHVEFLKEKELNEGPKDLDTKEDKKSKPRKSVFGLF